MKVITLMSIVPDREQQRRGLHRALSVAQFSEDYGVGRTKIYEELKSGRLRGRKIGKRTSSAKMMRRLGLTNYRQCRCRRLRHDSNEHGVNSRGCPHDGGGR
jgi:hypothetical protein